MAKVTLAIADVVAPYGTPAKVAYAAGDASLGNQFVAGNNLFLLARNTGGSERTVTIASVACPEGRTEDVVITIPAGETWQSGIIPKTGFKQADGYVYVTVSHLDVHLAVLRQR